MRKILGVLTEKMRVNEPPSATGGRFYYLSPQWHALLWGLLDLLDREEFWEDPENGIRWLYEAMSPETCLECGDGETPEPEPVPEPEIKVIYVDRWHEDEEENEDDSDMCKCINSVHYDPETATFYYMDANCNRVAIASQSLSDALGAGAWEDAGMPPVTDAPAVATELSRYNTEQALKCSKATALVNTMWDVIGIYQGIDEVTGILQIAAAVTAWLTGVGWAEVVIASGSLPFAAVLADAIAAFGLDQLQEELEANYLDTDAKDALICDLVPRMSGTPEFSIGSAPKTMLTEADIKVALDRFGDLVADSEWSLRIMKIFPMRSWKEVVTPLIPTTVCGCDLYTPAPDLTEIPTGCIRLELTRFTPILGSWNIEAETPNSVIASTATPVYGAGTDLPFTNTNNTSTSGDGWQHAVRALMEIAGDEAGWFVRRIEVSFDMSWASGTPQRDYLIAVATAAGSNFDVVASGGDLISNPSLAVNVGLQLSHIFVGIGINTGHNVAGTSRVTNITLYVYPAGYPEDEQIIHFDQNAC